MLELEASAEYSDIYYRSLICINKVLRVLLPLERYQRSPPFGLVAAPHVNPIRKTEIHRRQLLRAIQHLQSLTQPPPHLFTWLKSHIPVSYE